MYKDMKQFRQMFIRLSNINFFCLSHATNPNPFELHGRGSSFHDWYIDLKRTEARNLHISLLHSSYVPKLLKANRLIEWKNVVLGNCNFGRSFMWV
jgi:hypothetical protein